MELLRLVLHRLPLATIFVLLTWANFISTMAFWAWEKFTHVPTLAWLTQNFHQQACRNSTLR